MEVDEISTQKTNVGGVGFVVRSILYSNTPWVYYGFPVVSITLPSLSLVLLKCSGGVSVMNPHMLHSTFCPPAENLQCMLMYPKHLEHLKGPGGLG